MFLRHLLEGVSTGAIYALLGLAIAMSYQATRQINFAQGEMAMFTTFVAWQMMIPWGIPYWPAFATTLGIAFVLGVVVQRIFIHPIRHARPHFQAGVTIALFLIFNSLAGFFWQQHTRALPSPFGIGPAFGSSLLSASRASMIGVAIATLALLAFVLTRTRTGLQLRAAAANRESARLVGVPVDRMAVLGWGLSAALGALAGMLVAPTVFVEPQMMFSIFPYALAGAVLGGLNTISGPVVGGFTLGIMEALAVSYLPAVGLELKLTIAVAVILVVLSVRPQGLLGRRLVERY